MFYSTFNNKYFQFYVHYTTCCYRHLGRITAILDGSKFLSFYFNYTSYTPYLAGSAAYLVGLIALHLLALLSSYITTV